MNSLEKPKRIKNVKLLNEVRGAPCCICGRYAEAAHIKTKGSHGDDIPSNLMALCWLHHREQHELGIKTFFTKYPQAEAWDTYKIKLERRQWAQ